MWTESPGGLEGFSAGKIARTSMKVRLALNDFAFHWSFPEIVADETGLFRENGVEVEWRSATPAAVTNKTRMYTDLMRERETDVYHAGEWACVLRVSESDDAWIAAKSDPGRGTLNSTFSIYVRPDAGVASPADLSGEAVAIEAGTGSYYTAMVDLERFMPTESVKLVQIGEPHRRLLALLDGEVKAASLVGPWTTIGDVFGLRRVIRTARRNPTTMVTRRDFDQDLFGRFLSATNGAIRIINREPGRFAHSYFRRVEGILEQMPRRFAYRSEEIRRSLRVPAWRPWVRYTAGEFRETSRWMAARGVLGSVADPDGLVAVYPRSVYS